MISTLSPAWFRDTEILFDLVFMIVTGIVTLVSFKAYRFFKDERHRLHSMGFLLLSASYLLLAVTNLFITLELREVDYSFHQIVQLINLTTIGSLLHALFFLAGLTYLVILYLQVNDRSVRLLLFTLVLFGVLISHQLQGAFFVFVAILLLFITIKLARNYMKKRKIAALLVLGGFIGLFIGEVLLSILFVSQMMYVIAGVLTLVSYLLILASLVVR